MGYYIWDGVYGTVYTGRCIQGGAYGVLHMGHYIWGTTYGGGLYDGAVELADAFSGR